MGNQNLILRLDLSNTTFQKTFRRLATEHQKEARLMLGQLIMMDTAQPPAKLHFHPLTNKQVPSALDPGKKTKVYTIHITRDDTYKASFTLEDGTAYLRVCGEHDEVDKQP